MKNIVSTFKKNISKSQKDGEDLFGFLKWVIKTEITIAFVIFIIVCTYKLIPQKSIFEIKHYINKKFIDNNDNDVISDYFEDEYKNTIEKSINNNKNLNDEEKQFFIQYLKDEINENNKFITIEKVSKRLEKLKIIYNKKYYYDKKINDYKSTNLEYEMLGIAGSYNGFFNKVNLYEHIKRYEITQDYKDKEFGFAECNKEALFHELNHLLAKNSLNTITNKSVFLETINEIFTKEYYYSKNNMEDEDVAYDEFMMYAYGLAEILPDEVIRKYKFDNNESILIEGLLDIDDNVDKAYDLVSSVNSLKILEKEKSKDIYIKYQKIHDSFKYYYEKKYNEKMENNIDFLLLFYNTPVQNKEERKIVENYLDNNKKDIHPKKGYFSEKYIEKIANNNSN